MVTSTKLFNDDRRAGQIAAGVQASLPSQQAQQSKCPQSIANSQPRCAAGSTRRPLDQLRSSRQFAQHVGQDAAGVIIFQL
ncbi:hypothetical protein, partial [Sandarakinorhabdus sp.]|uniref:hypothetical protein n=1 Tax=Sandarakinorhabdus sp. TaxID=1916663 RepID=UPI003340D296